VRGVALRNYFSVFLLREIKKGNSAINQALLKYGYSNFSLEILEYCSAPEKAIEREQFYLDLLHPEYNILQIAGSSLGYKHSEETIVKLKARKLSEEAKKKQKKISERMKGNTYGAALKGRKRSEETIAKHSERMKGNTYGTALKDIKRSEETIAKHSERMKGNTYGTALKGIKRSEETIAKLKGRIRPEGAGTPSISLEVLDLQTGEKTVYVSMSAFANFLGVPAARIASYFSSKTKKPYKGRYEMRKISS
jgi:group I intron endonuclease